MKKQNLFLYIAIVASIVLSVLLFVKVIIDDKINKEAIAQLGRENMLLGPILQEQLELSDFSLINIADSKVCDINGNHFVLSDSLKTDKTIVIYISMYYCKDCVNFVLEHIKILNDRISRDKVVILADKYIPRDINVFARANGIKNNFYTPEDRKLQDKMENVGMPVVFIADKNSGDISHVFVPHKEVPQYFAKYIDIVAEYMR